MSFLGGGNTGNYENAPSYTGLSVQTSAYGLVIPVIFGTCRVAGNLIWYGDFQAIAHDQATSGGKGGEPPTQKTYTYAVSFAMSLAEGPAAGLGRVWRDKAIYAEGSPPANMVFFDGEMAQAAWAYLASAHPDQAINYPGLVYVAIPNHDLGDSANMPQWNFEIKGPCIAVGKLDANPADIVSAIVTSARYGLDLSAALLDVSDYASYALASDFLISPAFNEQKAAIDHIKDVLEQTNADCIWHDGEILKIIPYGDSAITGNGVTWTPDIAPKFDLSDDDFIIGGKDEDPIKVTRIAQSDAYNDVQIEYLDRANNYAVSVATAKDQANIDIYGLRTDSAQQMHSITQGAMAQAIAHLKLQRGLYTRNQYEFSLGWKYCMLEPMDVVTLTDTALGMEQYPVRIVSIDENENGDLAIVAEDFPQGIGHATQYPSQQHDGYSHDYNVDPGNVNQPVLFNAPAILATAKYEVWGAISGSNENWGGCDIYASTDDATYKYIGSVRGASRYGHITATLATGSDPDTVNTLSVDLSVCKGSLVSGTQADANNRVTLCMVDTELIAYQSAELTSQYKYDLSYLRRGCHNSAIGEHAANVGFVRLDDRLFKYPLPDGIAQGQTIYLKFRSFNIYGAGLQDLAVLESHAFIIGAGVSRPSDVEGVSSEVSLNGLKLSWALNNSAEKIDYYRIKFNPATTGVTWQSSMDLTSVYGASVTIPAALAGTYLVKAVDMSGNLSNNAAMVITTLPTVVNFNAQQVLTENPAWSGTKTNMAIYNGNLLMQDVIALFDNISDFDAVGNFDRMGDTAPSAYYQSATRVDLGSVQTFRCVANVSFIGIDAGQSFDDITDIDGIMDLDSPLADVGVQPQIRLSQDGTNFDDWQAFTIGDFTGRACEFRVYIYSNNPNHYVRLDALSFTVDMPDRLETSNGAIMVADGGCPVTFSKPFMSVQKIGVSINNAQQGDYYTITSQTSNGFTVQCFDKNNTGVSRSIYWDAKGY